MNAPLMCMVVYCNNKRALDSEGLCIGCKIRLDKIRASNQRMNEIMLKVESDREMERQHKKGTPWAKVTATKKTDSGPN